ncbi:MAG: hypothetical protein H7338_14385 [Candidatus Sericytochromatia bacterium]|nr:hypothetical protein [Candidatus Sericytochromatia bacterium]
MRLEHTQTPLTINVFLSLADCLMPASLALALGDVLADYPILRTRAVSSFWGYRRDLVALADIDFRSLITWAAVGDRAAEAAFIQKPLPPETDLPVRLFVQPHAHGACLIVSVHHSAVDAVGENHLIDRLAFRYGECARGITSLPLVCLNRPTYGTHLRQLTWWERFQVLRYSAAVINDLVAAARGAAYATFQDLPIPARGATRWVTVPITGTPLAALHGWRKYQGGTLNDVLMAAFLVACCQVWPEEVGKPIVVHVPVNLRQGPDVVIGNQVADVRIVIPSTACTSFEAAYAAVCAATPPARARLNAVARIFERALASYLPPSWFRRAVTSHLDQPANPVLSLSFSNLGDLGGRPRDFGATVVQDLFVLGPLSVPPGISAWVTTFRGEASLCIGYVEPVVTHESANAVAEAFVSLVTKISVAGQGRHEGPSHDSVR